MPKPALAVTSAIIGGIVKSVMMLLNAVRVTESATSPPASMENTLLDEPPGQQAMSMVPITKIGARLKPFATHQAITGRRRICPHSLFR